MTELLPSYDRFMTEQSATPYPEPIAEPSHPQFGALDLGSNSFHLLVARESNDGIQVVDRHKEMVRLAEGLTGAGQLSNEVADRALNCLQRFAQRLRSVRADNLRIVGTNTLRQLQRSRGFIDEAERILGHPIEVISGREEARLIYLGVCQSLGDNSRSRLVIDIGGGSTELIIGQHFIPKNLESLHMGCVSMSKRYFADGYITAESFQCAVDDALVELEPIMQPYLNEGWEQALGASGTVNAIAAVQTDMGLGSELTPDNLELIKQQLLSIDDPEKMPGLDPERVRVFPGGLAILIALFEAFGIETMEVAQSALREGVIYDLLGRQRHIDIRDQTVASLAKRYNTDTQQAARVGRTALNLLADLDGYWQLNAGARTRLLGWAADLHELGKDISHSGFHKHGSYLLSNLDMPGFSQLEQQHLATLVALHRRKLNLSMISERHPWLLPLALVLRLASLLHRGRSAQNHPPVQLIVASDAELIRLELHLDRYWLQHHPLTWLDLKNEVANLADSDIQLSIVQLDQTST